MIKVFDNLVPLSYQEEIKQTLLGSFFPWYYSEDLTYASGSLPENRIPGCSHVFRKDNRTLSNSYNLFSPLTHIAAEAAEIKFSSVQFCRAFLQFPLNTNEQYTALHVDMSVPHYVVLYYVNDSDAETVLVDKKFENQLELNPKVEDYSIIQKVKPKQGRILVFDGLIYHSVEVCKKGMRCVLNFDLI